MRSLFEISQDMEQCFDMETGELDEAKFDALTLEWEQKVEAVALYVKEKRMLVSGMETEKKNLEDRIRVEKNAIDGMNKWLYRAIVELGGYSKFETPKAKVTFRRSEQVDIVEERMIPEKFMDVQVVRKPMKKLIKEAIKGGEQVAGVTLTEKVNTQIK